MGSAKTTLGEFEHHVLVAAIIRGRGAFAGAIVEELEGAAPQRAVSAAAVYIALRRLEEHGLVESELRAGTGAGGSRQRRYFVVTDAGMALAEASRRSLMRLWRGWDELRQES